MKSSLWSNKKIYTIPGSKILQASQGHKLSEVVVSTISLYPLTATNQKKL